MAKQIISSILGALLWVLIALLALLIASGILQRVRGDRGYTGLFGLGYAVVVSGSMEPNIHINDMIVYQRVPQEEYTVGSVIVYLRKKPEGDMLITHRIIAVNGDTVTTKGDANPIKDSPDVPYESVIGKVIWRLPYVGVMTEKLRTKTGVLVSAGLILFLILLELLIGRVRRKRRTVRTVMGEQHIDY